VTELRRTKIWDLDLTLAQKLEDFDENKILDVKKLFKWENFITLDNEILEKINVWIKVIGKFDFEVWIELFVFDGKNITNIVKYDGNALISEKNFKKIH
jgi:hypothetical protein